MKYNRSFLQNVLARQRGQSMVEYTVIATFGILFMTSGPMRPIIEDLADTIRSNFDGYTYAVSISEYPDKEDPITLISHYNSQGMPIEQVQYLVDYPEDMINDILSYNTGSFPSVQDGLDLLDEVGLGVDDFCGEGCPLSLF